MRYLVSPVAVALCLLGSTAHAHAHLESSSPKEGSTVSAAPSNIELKFSEPVRITALSIQKEDEKPRPLGPLPEKPAAKIAVAGPALDAGKYAVNYRVVSGDSHIMSGTLHFAVSASQAMDPGNMDQRKTDHGNTNHGTMDHNMDNASTPDHH